MLVKLKWLFIARSERFAMACWQHDLHWCTGTRLPLSYLDRRIYSRLHIQVYKISDEERAYNWHLLCNSTTTEMKQMSRRQSRFHKTLEMLASIECFTYSKIGHLMAAMRTRTHRHNNEWSVVNCVASPSVLFNVKFSSGNCCECLVGCRSIVMYCVEPSFRMSSHEC